MGSVGQERAPLAQPPGTSPGTQVAATPRLLASWQRSEHYGVSVDAVEPTFTGSLDTDSLLYECGSQVLEALQYSLGNEPISLMVADRDGMVIKRLCNDRAILASLDKVHLAPGFTFSERAAGTNGLGLSLADRAPTLVRAEEHYCTALRGYTCAAAPVLDPLGGDLIGTINLTTWSGSSSELLLALAQSAAGNTSAMMQVRSAGAAVRRSPRGEIFHVVARRKLDTDDVCTSTIWKAALSQTHQAVRASHVVAVVGEDGAGKSTLAALGRRSVAQRQRVMIARVPDPKEIAGWLALWTPELESRDTCIIVTGVDTLPAWAAGELAETFARARRIDAPQPFVMTAHDYEAIPDRLAALVDTVVELAALRQRGADVMPLARHMARQERRREVGFTSAAMRALGNYAWPGNVTELRQVVRAAAARANLIDTQHLDPTVFTSGGHVFSRLECFERDELIRCLTAPNATAAGVAIELGISRATVYRKIAQYGIKLSRHSSAR